jgi:hypothetical protein
MKHIAPYRQLKLILLGGYIATICLCFSFAAPAFAQGADSSSLGIYNGCGMEGEPGVPAFRH